MALVLRPKTGITGLVGKAVLVPLCIVAWVVPGAGHIWLRRTQKGLFFLIVLPLMFVTGLWLNGQIFIFDLTRPLVALAAIADCGIGAAYFIARIAGQGGGQVIEESYEYGNSFLIVAGLLNFLVVIDVYDIARGRK